MDRSKTGLDATALADRYYLDVFRLAWRLTGSRESGEDIAQEVFLHLHRRAISLNPDSFPLAYLRQMTARRCYKLLREGRALPMDPMPEEEFRQPAAAEPSGPSLEDRQQLVLVMQCVSRLHPKSRAVYLLCEVEELSTEEVATMLGMMQVTVRRHRMIAREKIRVMMEVKS